jgi:hypothetical protein
MGFVSVAVYLHLNCTTDCLYGSTTSLSHSTETNTSVRTPMARAPAVAPRKVIPRAPQTSYGEAFEKRRRQVRDEEVVDVTERLFAERKTKELELGRIATAKEKAQLRARQNKPAEPPAIVDEEMEEAVQELEQQWQEDDYPADAPQACGCQGEPVDGLSPLDAAADLMIGHLIAGYLPRIDAVLLSVGGRGDVARCAHDQPVLRDRPASCIALGVYDAPAPWRSVPCDLTKVDEFVPFDVAVLAYSMSDMAPRERRRLLDRLRLSMVPGGAIIILDRFEARGGLLGRILGPLGMCTGSARPLTRSDVPDAREFMRFGDIRGFVIEG